MQKIEQDVRDFKNQYNSRSQKNAGKLDDISAFRILVDLISGICTGGFIGYAIDSYLQTLPLMLFVCLVLGMMGGIFNYYKNFKQEKQKEVK